MRIALALVLLCCSPSFAARRAAVLNWQPPASSEPYYRYKIYKAEGSGPFSLLVADLNRLTFTDYNVKNKTSYRYQVTTLDTVSGLESQPSNVVTANF